MRIQYDMKEVENAPEWLLERLSTEPAERMEKITTLLWGVWLARNKRIFEGKVLPPAVLMKWSKTQIEEWKTVNKKQHRIAASQGAENRRRKQK